MNKSNLFIQTNFFKSFWTNCRKCLSNNSWINNSFKRINYYEGYYGFALIRPAGHHSSQHQIGTFCGFNSISIGTIEIVKVNRSGGTEQILRQLSKKYPNQLYLIDIYAAFGKIFHSKVISDIKELNPSFILISAGYDGDQGESPDGYFQMTRLLKQLNIPLGFILEGGYQLNPLNQSIGATFEALIQI